MFRNTLDVDEIAKFAYSLDDSTRIYLGCDSERLRHNGIWYADYTTVAVVHINSNQGCRIYGNVERERDFDQHVDRPKQRLMNEVYRVARLYLEISKVIPHEIEVHLDINPDERFNSSLVVNEAVGYIRGTCNVIPKTKPQAWAASGAADRYKEVFGGR